MIKINEVALCEGMHLTEASMRTLVELSQGDMRRALNLLQSLQMGNFHKEIQPEDIY